MELGKHKDIKIMTNEKDEIIIQTDFKVDPKDLPKVYRRLEKIVDEQKYKTVNDNDYEKATIYDKSDKFYFDSSISKRLEDVDKLEIEVIPKEHKIKCRKINHSDMSATIHVNQESKEKKTICNLTGKDTNRSIHSTDLVKKIREVIPGSRKSGIFSAEEKEDFIIIDLTEFIRPVRQNDMWKEETNETKN